MDPITLSLLFGLGNAGIKGITALNQNKRAAGLEQMQRPEYTVPSAINESTGAARMAYNDPNMYAASLAQQNIQQNGAQALRAARESGAGPNATIAAASSINSGMNDASRQIAIDTDQLRRQDLGRMMQALNVQGGYQNQGFMMSQMQPYLDQQQAAQDLRYAARGNTDSLMGDMTNLGTNLAYAGIYDKMYQSPAQAQVATQPQVSSQVTPMSQPQSWTSTMGPPAPTGFVPNQSPIPMMPIGTNGPMPAGPTFHQMPPATTSPMGGNWFLPPTQPQPQRTNQATNTAWMKAMGIIPKMNYL